jgi:hypothetical protein
MAGLIEILRSGDWLTRERMRLIAFGVLAASLIGVLWLLATAHGLSDRFGRPLGTDFSSFYAAGSLVREGLVSAPFDHAAHWAGERAIFGNATPYYAFQYPPIFLLIADALAHLPYLPALALWQGTSLLLYLLAIRAIFLVRLKGKSARGAQANEASSLVTIGEPVKGLWLPLALAFPAVFINLTHGQNGFLTAGLFALALVELDWRPLLAGLLIGLMAYKPQFGLMIPLVLLVSARWRVIVAAAATVVTLVAATLLVFGPDVWQAFFASMTFSRVVLLEGDAIGWYKLQSVFSWVRLWGGTVSLAYLIQGAVTLTVAFGLVRLWRSRARFPLKAAALLLGTLLSTPFCLDYDLMLLAPAIAFLAADGLEHGFAPYQKTVLAGLWIAPLITRSIAEAASIPVAVPVMLLSFGYLLHRGIAANPNPQTSSLLQSAP